MTNDGHELADEPAAMTFELLKAAVRDGTTVARLGRLALTGCKSVVDTPNYFGLTSRGVVPHVTPDNVSKHLQTNGAYLALEDFIERPQQYSTRSPPIYETPSALGKPLHGFTALPSSFITVLGARRLPAVPAPAGNTNHAVSIFTSTGFQVLPTKDYRNAVQVLKPDIAIPPADLTHGPTTPTSKRAVKMAERTDDWIKEWFVDDDTTPTASTFAPVLPIPYSMQWEYLERLSEDLTTDNRRLAGLALYDADIIPDLNHHLPNLLPLPRLSLAAPPTPHHILRQISLGVDLFALPFINATDLSPFVQNCTCYACTRHHRAFVHHLLSAHEMLGWTLLQLHNHAVVAAFFAGIRQTLAVSDDAFEAARAQFHAVYEPELPAGTGERPRARGYHFKSGAGEGKRNKPGWGKLGEEEEAAAVAGKAKGDGAAVDGVDGVDGKLQDLSLSGEEVKIEFLISGTVTGETIGVTEAAVEKDR
ncbi:tRNA-guanine(15) transglycosylase-like protein [Bombardia bombarda]|uniref:tRNA-guanine(15) transglycosylase-like protein n=1 Tax=Bombardia bombarda TaxID=252184 RepID=A0AA39XKJ4_9PEZI|nr:tRNA-guanine(15) transglycosylase-like protein [Bombardia bombarda]